MNWNTEFLQYSFFYVQIYVYTAIYIHNFFGFPWFRNYFAGKYRNFSYDFNIDIANFYWFVHYIQKKFKKYIYTLTDKLAMKFALNCIRTKRKTKYHPYVRPDLKQMPNWVQNLFTAINAPSSVDAWRVEYMANSFDCGYNRLRHALTARRGISERSTPL